MTTTTTTTPEKQYISLASASQARQKLHLKEFARSAAYSILLELTHCAGSKSRNERVASPESVPILKISFHVQKTSTVVYCYLITGKHLLLEDQILSIKSSPCQEGEKILPM